MSASTATYDVAREYGHLRPVSGVRADVSLARAFPTAGDAGLRLRLLEQLNAREEDAEWSDAPEVQVGEPGASLMWLGDVYSLVAQHDPDGAIDVLFARVDEMLIAGEFDHCDALLKTIDPKRLDSNLLIATLSATKRAAAKLPERRAFVRRVTARLKEVAPGRVERLLSGLV